MPVTQQVCVSVFDILPPKRTNLFRCGLFAMKLRLFHKYLSIHSWHILISNLYFEVIYIFSILLKWNEFVFNIVTVSLKFLWNKKMHFWMKFSLKNSILTSFVKSRENMKKIFPIIVGTFSSHEFTFSQQNPIIQIRVSIF